MDIVTLGSKAKDTQSPGISLSNNMRAKGVACLNTGLYQFLVETEEALKQGAKSARLLALASLSHRSRPAFARNKQVALAGLLLQSICLSP